MPDPIKPETPSSAEVGGTVLPCQKPPPTHWLEIEMVGEDDSPVPLLLFEVKLPDGKLVQGCVDDQGFARVDQIASPGICQVSFPEFDRDVWTDAATSASPSTESQ
jgi:hypothetical protein